MITRIKLIIAIRGPNDNHLRVASWKGAPRGTAGVGLGPEVGSLLLRTRFTNDFCMHAGGGEDRNATLQLF